MQNDIFVDFITVISVFYFLFYNAKQFRKNVNDVQSIAIGYCLYILIIILIHMSIINISVNLIRTGRYHLIAIGTLILFIFLWKLVIVTLKSTISIQIKIVFMLIIYIISILTIVYVFNLVTVTNVNVETLYKTFVNSYSLPELHDNEIVNVINAIQFLICKIFDVLILGIVINLVSMLLKKDEC
ncbi:MAG TPA: hypothetical protein DIC60_09665 [Lachnospiraceae bacterium]|nr:hypothetical protein [Lachnospiraceae bacterium]